MNFELTVEQKILKDSVRKFLEKEIAPIVDDYEKNHTPITKEIVRKTIPFGFIGGLLPEKYGGGGLDYITYFLMIEELSRVWPSLRAVVSGTNLLATYFYHYGTDSQKEKYLPKILNGDVTGFFALTEPNVGSDASNIETTATLRDDKWIINGSKMFITNGVDGDLGIVLAQTDKSKGINGITAFIVEKEKADYHTKAIEKMGMHSCPTAELYFENCEIPKGNVLGNTGDGLRLGLDFLNTARVMVNFICSGVAQASLDAAIKYARERKQFGKEIGSFQLIQAKIAEMATKLKAMKLMGLEAASKLERGENCRLEASMAKMFGSETALEIVDTAIQIHGGYGYSREFQVERLYRDIRHFTFAEGTSEIHRLLIGRQLIGISAFI
ncbi:acyl-CoA dehydrogenase family protein [Bacillus dakarensis]|uniref:acyl-CoA dehydrogenase family protein n=1 Tax=Robertmurraya dakarensis TaxID=1926278 RepID=UPI0009814513|nr:acyl-CoA dehydrogenase family protein [Bacillus dakarensis]